MSLERFKMQVLLLHSEQHTLDNLSSGFNDRYTVHCATSGSEALNTLGETQIDVIISAQRLPGMSGLEALREAKKRSPETIGILLAGNEDDGLEALVGDQEVFQVVRGSITPDALTSLIDSATQQARLLALAESANDMSANPDEPVGEHIVMETSENGSTIISDGTGRLPALNPKKVSTAAGVGARAVDVLVLTQDQEFLATVKESARGLHHIVYANTMQQADEAVRRQKVGVAVIDAAMVGADVETLTLHLRSVAPRLVAIVAGRRDDGEMLMELINRGKVYRFLLKPVSPGRSRLAIEASVRHHLEAPDAAFARAGKPAPAPRLFETTPPTPLKSAPKPAAKPAPKPAAKPVAKPAVKAAPNPVPAPKAPPKPAATEPPAPAATVRTAAAAPPAIVAKREDALSPIDDGLGNAFDGESSFTETVTGLVKSVGRSFSPNRDNATEPGADLAHDGAGGSVFGGPKLYGVAAIAIAAIAGAAFWMLGGSDEQPVVKVTEPAVSAPRPAVTETIPVPVDETAADTGPDLDALLADARQAVEDGRVVQPAGDNAIELYLSALETVPDDTTVESELAGAVDQALGLAENALLERRAGDAEAALDRVALADPDNSRLRFLEAQLADMQVRGHLDDALAAIRESRFEDARIAIEAARSSPVADSSAIDIVADELAAALSQQRTDEVLAKANARLDEGRLIAPSNDNARYYYELALSNDPNSAAARQGLVTIAGKLILKARTEIDASRFDTAADLIADARRLDPQSTEVAAADGALQAARDRQERERLEAARRAAEQRAAAEQAAARRAAEERAAAERAAAEKAAAQRLSIEQLAQTTADDTGAARQPGAGTVQQPVAPGPQATAADTARGPDSGAASLPAGEIAQQPVAAAEQAEPAFSRTFVGREPQLPASGGVTPEPAEQEPVSATTLKRTKYVAPKYPRNAMRRDISGWVDIVFTVDFDGTVSDVTVSESYPDDSFDAAATRAVEDWEYEPVIEDGVAIRKRAAVRMSFELQ